MSVWYVPTTRNNAVGMLSSGLVTPALGLFRKYEADIQSLTPGKLLLTRTGFRRDWAGREADGPIAPALIRVNLEAEGEALDSGGSTILAYPGVVPLSRVDAVIFPDDRSEREFRARRYDNFDPRSVELCTAPELFHDDLPSAEEIRTWGRSLDARLGPSERDLRDADLFGGALHLLFALPGQSGRELAVRGTILDSLLTAPSEAPVPEVVSEALSTPQWLSEQASEDEVLLRATVAALHLLAPAERFGVRRFVSTVRNQLVSGSDIVAANLDRVEAILRGEIPLPRLRVSSGLRSAKALLLLLLRPSAYDLVAWCGETEVSDDPLSVTGAALLCGFLHGGRALPTALRRSEVAPVVADVQADRMNAASTPCPERFTVAESITPKVVAEDAENGERKRALYLGQVRITAVQDMDSESAVMECAQLQLFSEKDSV